MPAKKITLTETELSADDAEILALYLAAKRASTQAEAIMERLKKRVYKMAAAVPPLLYDSARVTPGKMVVWSYNTPEIVVAEHQLDQLQRQARARFTAGDKDSGATCRIVTFPQVKELSKFTGQIPGAEKPEASLLASIFRNMFTRRDAPAAAGGQTREA